MPQAIRSRTTKTLASALMWGVVFTAGVFVPAAEALPSERRPYHFVSLDAALPAGFLFMDPVTMTDDRRVYGTGYKCDAVCLPSILVYKSGTMSVLHDGIAYTANAHGTVGGSLRLDPDTDTEQAAIFSGTGVHVIPRLPGESTSHVRSITDSGTALVESVDGSSLTSRFYLYDTHHKVSRLNLGPDRVTAIDLNNDNIVAGTLSRPPMHDRAFRYNPHSGAMTILNPIASDPMSWGQGINQDGEVLGYSFTPGGLERIGVWHQRTFQTYFIEGTPAFPTVSNRLLWNRKGLIVITGTTRADMNSYIVPKPNVRLKLSDLSDSLPSWTLMTDVNARGDMIGSGGSSYSNVDANFLLERVG